MKREWRLMTTALAQRNRVPRVCRYTKRSVDAAASSAAAQAVREAKAGNWVQVARMVELMREHIDRLSRPERKPTAEDRRRDAVSAAMSWAAKRAREAAA